MLSPNDNIGRREGEKADAGYTDFWEAIEKWSK